MALDNWARQIDRDINGPAPDLTPKPGLEELLNDDEKNKLFGYFLEKANKGRTLDKVQGAWNRYLKSEPTPADEVVIQDQYNEYQSRKARFETVHAAITKFGADMLEYSPVFKAFRDLKGDENVKRVLEVGLRDLALYIFIPF